MLLNPANQDFNHCKQIMDDGLYHLAKLTNLTTLDLSGCKKITYVERKKHLAGLENLVIMNW